MEGVSGRGTCREPMALVAVAATPGCQMTTQIHVVCPHLPPSPEANGQLHENRIPAKVSRWERQFL